MFTDIVSGRPPELINIYEMTFPLINDLCIQAKRRAKETGFKHVWLRNNNVFVKKSDTFTSIPIVTEDDLNKII